MKLAEALILRADLQTRLEQLRERLTANALVQEGEKPAEDPEALLKELEETVSRLEEIITRINLTNAATLQDGESLTAMLARRECLMQKISVMRSLMQAASHTVMRGSRMEVKIFSTVPVAELRKKTDQLSVELRKLDTSIQCANWTVELQ